MYSVPCYRYLNQQSALNVTCPTNGSFETKANGSYCYNYTSKMGVGACFRPTATYTATMAAMHAMFTFLSRTYTESVKTSSIDDFNAKLKDPKIQRMLKTCLSKQMAIMKEWQICTQAKDLMTIMEKNWKQVNYPEWQQAFERIYTKLIQEVCNENKTMTSNQSLKAMGPIFSTRSTLTWLVVGIGVAAAMSLLYQKYK